VTLTDQISSVRIAAAVNQSELGNIVASGRATPEEWHEYWSVYAESVERQRQEKERQKRELAEKQAQQKPVDDIHPPEIYYPQEPTETPRRNRSSAAGIAGRAGIGLGSALAVVLSFDLNHSVLWAIVHGVLSWFYVLYRAWQGNY
jgi:hypothetical protein